tara:strand:- start:737 stop:919 length:183 start_codon:yes stop_codon:yes gene_type:complete
MNLKAMNMKKGLKILNITLESPSAIEKMVNKAIDDIHKQKIKIIDLQITEDNIVLVLEED